MKKCPNCQKEMVKGLLTGDGMWWVDEKSFAGKVTKWGYLPLLKFRIYAYKCDNCGRTELYAEKT